ncbi:MAG: Aspartokinase [Chlamydiota bacterium]
MKFGGAAVATAAHFDRVAELIAEREGVSVVVVVSAMQGMTDQLIGLAKQVHPHPPLRELDMLVSVGERMSIALLAMALHKKGKEAISFTGSQSGVLTTTDHSNALIVDVKPTRIQKALSEGKVVIVAGFQGVSQDREITTLGRGGSDTSAVALGVALGAKRVEFYKDVKGVYSEDPKKNAEALFHPVLSYDEMLKILENGAKILHSRCVILAKKNSIPLFVCSFQEKGGTIIEESGKESASSCIYEVDPRPSSMYS